MLARLYIRWKVGRLSTFLFACFVNLSCALYSVSLSMFTRLSVFLRQKSLLLPSLLLYFLLLKNLKTKKLKNNESKRIQEFS